MSIEYTITEEYDGIKPKNYLKKRLDLPFYKIVKLIKEKRITLNGKKIKKESILNKGDILKIWPTNIQERTKTTITKESKNLNLEVIYDNNDFVVFNKLANIVVQGAQDNNTSISYHLVWYKNHLQDKNNFDYFHVHRLDKDTSGCLVIAKNLKTLRDFNKIFREHKIVKKYLCLCYGFSKEKEGEIKVFMKRNPEGSAKKMTICNKNEEKVRFSHSKYRILKEFELDGDPFSLVEIEILTGITHQIRVHLSNILNMPILGDAMYGNRLINEKYILFLNRQFLHASYLEFNYKGIKYQFTAKLTPDLKVFMKYLEKNSNI